MPPPLAQLRQAIIEFAADPTDSPLPRALGFTAVKHPANLLGGTKTPFGEAVQDVASAVHRAGYVETGQGNAGLYLVRLHDWGLRSSDRDRARRRIAKAFVHHPLQDSRTLIALLPPEWKDAKQRDVEFVIPKQRQKGDIATVRALVNAADPSGFHVRILQDLALADGMELATVSRHWAEAFSVERVTKAFYLEFEKLRDRIVESIQSNNKKHKLLSGDAQLAAVNRFATRQLGRILTPPGRLRLTVRLPSLTLRHLLPPTRARQSRPRHRLRWCSPPRTPQMARRPHAAAARSESSMQIRRLVKRHQTDCR